MNCQREDSALNIIRKKLADTYAEIQKQWYVDMTSYDCYEETTFRAGNRVITVM